MPNKQRFVKCHYRRAIAAGDEAYYYCELTEAYCEGEDESCIDFVDDAWYNDTRVCGISLEVPTETCAKCDVRFRCWTVR